MLGFLSCLFRCVLFFFEILFSFFDCLLKILFYFLYHFFDILWKLNVFKFIGYCVVALLFYGILLVLLENSGVIVEKTKPSKKEKTVEKQEPMSMMSDNSTSTIPPQTKYDVFVSFRGGDVRGRFLSHLIDIFQRNKINAFVDDRLKKGDKIWGSLVKAIEESSIWLIIFSEDYASSRWCLDEVVKVIECKEKYGGIVIPIFYHVEPADVRHQKGSYKTAFDKHKTRYTSQQLQIWRHALNKSAGLSGIESSTFRNDVDLLKEIVNHVSISLGNSWVKTKGLVGIDEKIKHVESLIHKEPKHTRRLIRIWGMGGIGKTTFAREIFNKLRSEYEGCYFLANEREQSIRHGIDSLRKEIFSGLLAGVEKTDTSNLRSNDIDRRIPFMKVLIVLDDVNDSDHLEKLLGPLDDNFGAGSRIIITTRDKQVLNAHKDEIYCFGELSSNEALELFKLNAFNQSDCPQDFDELSKKLVHYAQGMPLVLKVLAQLLRGKNEKVWRSQLKKLETVPLTKVYDVMKLSYDDLDPKEQHTFLDLACFFLGSHIIVNLDYLESLLKDGESDISVVAVLVRLCDKALITVSEYNVVSMHDLLQEMAWEIVRRENSKDFGSYSRLWEPNDIYEALKDDKSTESTRSIRIQLSTFQKQKLNLYTFAKMQRLQFLEISGECKQDCIDEHNTLAKGLQFLATKLRFLCWYSYPLKSLPENFSTEKLVILKLPKGEIQNLWDGVKNLENLKELDLTDSKMLEKLPDLSNAKNLEVLVLEGCSKLSMVHSSIFTLAKLEKLNLRYCKSLTILTSNSHLCSLSYLNLDNCEKLMEFSLNTDNIKELRLRWTKVEALSLSCGDQSKLTLLHLEGSSIKSLPSSIKNLMQLSYLDVNCCSELQKIPKLPTSLTTLEAKYCSSLEAIEELPPSLRTLRMGECKSLQTLPKFPSFLKTLTAQNCTSLKTILFPSPAEQIQENRRVVVFLNCLQLNQQSLDGIELNAKINLMNFANQHLSAQNHEDVENYNDYDKKYYYYQVVYLYPGSSLPNWLKHRTRRNCINIDLSSAPPLEGFIFCFVLGGYGDITLERIEANITVRDPEGNKESVGMYIYLRYCKVESDHLCLMYDQRCSAFLNSRAKTQRRFKIEVTMDLRSSAKEISIRPQRMFKAFGISPISTLALGI